MTHKEVVRSSTVYEWCILEQAAVDIKEQTGHEAGLSDEAAVFNHAKLQFICILLPKTNWGQKVW